MLVLRTGRFSARRRVLAAFQSPACQDTSGTNQRPSISPWLTTVAPPGLASCEGGPLMPLPGLLACTPGAPEDGATPAPAATGTEAWSRSPCLRKPLALAT